jgi:hypothetical protein
LSRLELAAAAIAPNEEGIHKKKKKKKKKKI